MMNNNLASLFQPKGIEEPTQQNTEEYRVSFKNGKGGIYRSIIRFIPFFANPDKSVMSKIVAWVVNPTTGRGIYVDDPRSVGQYSPITDMFFKFRNTNRPDFVEYGKKNLSTKQQYAALVQIIQDEQHPELQGQIKVWRFGKTIYDKLYAEMHPAMGEGVVPYHPIYGRYFSIVCTSQSGFNNFDQSGFFDLKDKQQRHLPTGILWLNPQTNKMEPVTENTDQQAVYDYLAANSPDLGKYDYHPWTSEQQEHVEAALSIAANYLQTGTIQQNLQTVVTNNNPVFPGSVQAVQTPSVTPTPTVAPPVTSVPNLGGSLNMGTDLNGGPTIPTPGNPMVSGIDIPNVEPATAPISTMPPQGLGNIDDILSQL